MADELATEINFAAEYAGLDAVAEVTHYTGPFSSVRLRTDDDRHLATVVVHTARAVRAAKDLPDHFTIGDLIDVLKRCSP
jgi:hypothetical protein